MGFCQVFHVTRMSVSSVSDLRASRIQGRDLNPLPSEYGGWILKNCDVSYNICSWAKSSVTLLCFQNTLSVAYLSGCNPFCLNVTQVFFPGSTIQFYCLIFFRTACNSFFFVSKYVLRVFETKSRTCCLFVRRDSPSLFMSAPSLAYPMPVLFHKSLSLLSCWNCSKEECNFHVKQLTVLYISLPAWSPPYLFSAFCVR